MFRLSPHIQKISHTNVGILPKLATALYNSRNFLKVSSEEDRDALDGLLQHLFTASANETNFNFTAEVPRPMAGTYTYSGFRNPEPPAHTSAVALIVRALQCGTGVKRLAFCDVIMARLTPSDTSRSSISTWFISWAQPFITTLQTILSKYDLDITLHPFSTYITHCVVIYVNRVLGPIPVDKVPRSTLGAIGCGCEPCNKTKDFLLGSKKEMDFGGLKPQRLHVQKVLVAAGALKWGMLVGGSQHTVTSTDFDALLVSRTIDLVGQNRSQVLRVSYIVRPCTFYVLTLGTNYSRLQSPKTCTRVLSGIIVLKWC